MNIAAFAATGIQETGIRLGLGHFGTGAAEEGRHQVSRQSREKRSPEKKRSAARIPIQQESAASSAAATSGWAPSRGDLATARRIRRQKECSNRGGVAF